MGLRPCASPTSRICSVRGVPTGTCTPRGQVWTWRARQPHSAWTGASPRFIGMSSSTGSGAARSPFPSAASRSALAAGSTCWLRWIAGVTRFASSHPPAYTAARLRALDQAIYDHACGGEPSALAEVFAALGRCRAAASRSGKVRGADLPELRLPDGAKLLDHLSDALGDDRELRIALAVATSRDERSPFRTWLDDPPLAGGLAAGLADIARRRSFPLATDETVRDRMLSVRGARIVFERGMRLRSGDILAFVEGGIDDHRTAALILGLSCCRLAVYASSENLPGDASPPTPALDLLLLFTSATPLHYTSTDGKPESLFVRPGHEWAAQLIAGHIPDVLLDASRRLRIGGLRHVVTVPDAPYDGTRLAAALLMSTAAADRRAALSRVAVVGSHRITPIQEATA